MNYFEKTQKLMLMVEQIVIETKFDASERVAAVLHRFLFGPVGFLLLGLRAIFTSLALWAVTAVVLTLILWGFARSRPEASGAASTVGVFVAGGFIMFMLPSACATSEIKSSWIKAAKKAVLTLVSDGSAISCLSDAMNVMKIRCQERVKRLSWALGIAWAVFFWAFTNTVLKDGLAASERNHNANDLFGYCL